MRPNLITRLKEEWNNLDPVDPLRGLIADAIDALAEQPAQQEEPMPCVNGCQGFFKHSPQPSKPWVGLTQKDIDIAFDDTQEGGGFDEFARAIEAKLKERNA